MVLTLYGTPKSSYTQRVLLILKETRTPYEWVETDPFVGAQKETEFMKKHPFGQIPCLVDDGFVVFESRAICKYIAAQTGGTALVPAGDVKQVARFEQALSIEQANYDPFAQQIVRQRIVFPRFGRPTEEARVQEAAQTLEGKLVVYNQILSEQKYLAGDELTMADLYHLPYGVHLLALGFTWLEDKERFPNLARWWAEISSRPSWIEISQGGYLCSV